MNKSLNQRIAVIGSGISGLTAAYMLSRRYNVYLFEAEKYIGGHTHTVPVSVEQDEELKHYLVDTGFIVCNDRNYPRFLNLLNHLGVELQATEMSFSVRNPGNRLEYNGHSLDTLFAQRRNFLRPGFIRLIRDIKKFNKIAKNRLRLDEDLDITLGEFLDEQKYGKWFRENYLFPMVSAIWSCSMRQAESFPLAVFLRFFRNHGLLDLKNRPQWYVLQGGSHSYVEPMIMPFRNQVSINSRVSSVTRVENGVRIRVNGENREFDQVVLACHSDQALALLSQPTTAEQEILSNMPYQENTVILHTDDSMMPARKKVWASWNFLAGASGPDGLPTVTYCMNILQGIGSIDDPSPLLVSLNASHLIDPDKVIRRFSYSHPVFTLESAAAQSRREEISGVDRIHYCGAYWYNGFHEDGVRSALDVSSALGVAHGLTVM